MAGLEAMACSMACWLSVVAMWGACVCCAKSFDGDKRARLRGGAR